MRVSGAESERIRRHLGIGRAWFRRRYLTRLEDGLGYGIALRAGRCVFLRQDLRCAIYAVRPVQCQTYPFWPELVGTARAWRAEGGRCEGIGEGRAVPVVFIERQVRRQKLAEDEPS